MAPREGGVAYQLPIGQPPPVNPFAGKQESICVGSAALVESERLFVEIPEQVERLNADVGSSDGALEQAPEIFKAVRVNIALRVANRMVNRLVGNQKGGVFTGRWRYVRQCGTVAPC